MAIEPGKPPVAPPQRPGMPPPQHPMVPGAKGAAPKHPDIQDDWMEGSGTIKLETLTAEDQKALYDGYQRTGNPKIYPTLLAGNRNDILILLHGNLQVFPKPPTAEPKEPETPVQKSVNDFVKADEEEKKAKAEEEAKAKADAEKKAA